MTAWKQWAAMVVLGAALTTGACRARRAGSGAGLDGAVPAASRSGWKVIREPGFKVEMPSSPKRVVSKVDTLAGERDEIAFVTAGDAQALRVVDLGAPADAQAMLQDAESRWLKRVESRANGTAKVIARKDEVHAGHPARVIHARVSLALVGVDLHVRFVAAGTREMTLQTSDEDGVARAFVESMELTD